MRSQSMNIINSFALRNSLAQMGSQIHSDIHLGVYVYTKIKTSPVEESKETSMDLEAS